MSTWQRFVTKPRINALLKLQHRPSSLAGVFTGYSYRYIKTTVSPTSSSRIPTAQSRLRKGLILASIILAGFAYPTTIAPPTMSAKLIPPNPSEVMVIRNVTPECRCSLCALQSVRHPEGGWQRYHR